MPFAGSQGVNEKVKGTEPPISIPSKEKRHNKFVNVKLVSEQSPVVKSLSVRAKRKGIQLP